MNVLYEHNLVIEALCWLIAVKKQRGVGAVCGCPSVCLGVVHGAITPVIAHGSMWPQAESHPSEQQTHTFSCMCRITSPSGGLKVKNYFLNLSADYLSDLLRARVVKKMLLTITQHQKYNASSGHVWIHGWKFQHFQNGISKLPFLLDERFKIQR